MGRLLTITSILLILAGCISNRVKTDWENLPEGVSYIGCNDIDGQWNGQFTSAQAEGLECLKVGTGFDDVTEIETRQGKVTFK